jgi:hypothetical protein
MKTEAQSAMIALFFVPLTLLGYAEQHTYALWLCHNIDHLTNSNFLLLTTTHFLSLIDVRL